MKPTRCRVEFAQVYSRRDFDWNEPISTWWLAPRAWRDRRALGCVTEWSTEEQRARFYDQTMNAAQLIVNVVVQPARRIRTRAVFLAILMTMVVIKCSANSHSSVIFSTLIGPSSYSFNNSWHAHPLTSRTWYHNTFQNIKHLHKCVSQYVRKLKPTLTTYRLQAEQSRGFMFKPLKQLKRYADSLVTVG